MTTLKQAMLSAGFKPTPQPKKQSTPKFGPQRPSNAVLAKNAERTSRLAIFTQDLAREIRAATRNPSTSGSMHAYARLVDAAGSDTGQIRKMTGPRVRFGWTGLRGGQSHPEEKE